MVYLHILIFWVTEQSIAHKQQFVYRKKLEHPETQRAQDFLNSLKH